MNTKLKKYDSILILLILSLVLVDWRINAYITFSDLLVVIALFILLIKNYVKLEKKQLLIYFFVTAFVSFNTVIHHFLINDFEIVRGIIGTLKVGFYLSSIILFYNFISFKKLEIRLLSFLYKAATIVCIIGIYIYISISLGNILPYEFMWKFTRSDLSSYTYGWFDNIFRMRSIFSEPAHMGFFLLIVMGISYFNKFEYTLNKRSDLLITLSLILSFSFSSIVILIIVKLLNLIKNKTLFKLYKNQTSLLLIPVFITFLITIKDTISITFISRIQRMILGIDTSASARLSGSWSYINYENFLLGNGIGITTNIYNNYANIVSDLGILGIVIFIAFNLQLLKHNRYLFVLFILLNFMKGGYLGSGFWIFMMIFAIFSFKSRKDGNYIF